MSNNSVNDLRRSAAVTTGGPGAIVDARADRAPVSGIHAGLESWDKEAPLEGDLANQKIYERRLLSKLNKKFFRLAPVIASKSAWQGRNPKQSTGHEPATPSLLLRRFPNWLQCPRCENIKPATKWKTDPGKAYRFCALCTEKSPGKEKQYVVPVRLVSACIKGHLDDFPWDWWVRHKTDCNSRTSELRLYSKGTGLGGFHVECRNCKAERSMESAFNKSALSGLYCSGRRPWLDTNDESCDCKGETGDYRALQRGASNLYYPIFESALDIPPWTEPIQALLNDWWDTLLNIPDREQRLTWVKLTKSVMDAATRVGLSAEDVVDTFERMKDHAAMSSNDDIRLDEYRIFNGQIATKHAEFEAYPSKLLDDYTQKISTLTRVPRLREVRVLRGFTRIKPPQENQTKDFAPLSAVEKEWLPAIEIRGEGIFVSLDSNALKDWESQDVVREKCEKIEHEYQQDFARRYPQESYVPRLVPRKLLVHSLSHSLMRQLTLECGYSSASLRERLYVSDEDSNMAGILIYTGTADSDGTLGGLQARAKKELFNDTLRVAIKAARWCSSDPICIEGKMAPREMSSGASCHSCLLVSETSCEYFNKFLDRSLLIGTPDSPTLGFFHDW